MNTKIDIVIPWVDGNEKRWAQKKAYWQEQYKITSNKEERYRDWENLKYLFRGIEKYAKWVNHVYLVTDNQSPSWLDSSYDKVTVVDHKEIIPSKHLPVFNANPIELNIHRISELSENFIYFNDDIFIIDYIKETDFFKDNIPVDTGIMEVIYPKKVGSIQKIMINDLGLINEKFDKKETILEKPLNWFNYKYGKYNINNLILMRWPIFTNFINQHLTLSFNKETFNKVWLSYEKELLETVERKFRTVEDYNVWLMRYWQLASNKFIPRNNKLGTAIQIRDKNDAEKCADIIRNKKEKIICINDNEYTKDFEQLKNIINKSFKEVFTEKSKFEL